MGVPSYVLNWDELLDLLKDYININAGGEELADIEDMLGKYFPEIIDLLKKIFEAIKKLKMTDGMQRIKGYHQQVIEDKTYVFEMIADEELLLTGITYAQSSYKCEDCFDLIVERPNGEGIHLFENLYVKDALQHKRFEVFFPVPIGYKVKLFMYNRSSRMKDAWVDFEYIGLSSITEEGTIIIRYLAEGQDDFIVLAEEERKMSAGIHQIINDRTFTGYIAKSPTTRVIDLAENETRIVEFYFEQNDIAHDYDIKVILRWENNSAVDLDMYGFINYDSSKKVYYRQKEYFETEEDRLWLDYDYRSHSVDGYQYEPEVITLLGFKQGILSIQIQNFNEYELTQDVYVEVNNRKGLELAKYTIPKALLNRGSTRNVYVCDINVEKQVAIEKIIAIENVGAF